MNLDTYAAAKRELEAALSGYLEEAFRLLPNQSIGDILELAHDTFRGATEEALKRMDLS